MLVANNSMCTLGAKEKEGPIKSACMGTMVLVLFTLWGIMGEN